NQDQAMLQALLNILVFNMTPQEAVEAPRFQTEHFYASFADHQFTPGKLNLEGRIPRETAAKLTALGHLVTLTGDWSNSSARTVLNGTGGAKWLGGALHSLSRVRNGNAGISAEMAIRLEEAGWSNADHWLRLQTAYDLAQARRHQDQIKVKRYERQMEL